MNFGEALEHMKDGSKVRRAGSNETIRIVNGIVDGAYFATGRIENPEAGDDADSKQDLLDGIDTVSILADDWEVVP